MNPEPDGRPQPTATHRSVRLLRVSLVAAALVSPLARLGARVDWRLDLLTHFPEPAFALSVLAALIFFRLGRRRARLPRSRHAERICSLAALGFAILATVQVVPLVRFSGPNPRRADPRGGRVKILMANALHTNRDYRRLVALIKQEEPDVVGLVEFSEGWRASMNQHRLAQRYPYRYEWPHEAEGVALYFRRRPISVGPVAFARPDGGNPVLPATIDLDGRPVHLWLVHPPSPLAKRGRSFGKGELAGLARLVAEEEGAKVVIGDLNRTEGSPLFDDFLARAGLVDSRFGFGRQASWPVALSYRIPIDHALVSPDLAVVDRRLGPAIGSDHFPLIVELGRASAGREARNEATNGPKSSP